MATPSAGLLHSGTTDLRRDRRPPSGRHPVRGQFRLDGGLRPFMGWACKALRQRPVSIGHQEHYVHDDRQGCYRYRWQLRHRPGRCPALCRSGSEGDHHRRRAEALLDAAGDHPGISAFVADAGVSLDAARTVAKAIEVHGRLDVLVCNAGAGAILPLARATADQIMGILAVNVLGPSLLAVAALHLTRCWALELAPHGVRVNAIAPGPTDSGALTGMMGLSPEQAAAIEKQERERIPLGRRGNPDEVARWIIALADPVSEWVTGQVIAIDGGLGLA